MTVYPNDPNSSEEAYKMLLKQIGNPKSAWRQFGLSPKDGYKNGVQWYNSVGGDTVWEGDAASKFSEKAFDKAAQKFFIEMFASYKNSLKKQPPRK